MLASGPGDTAQLAVWQESELRPGPRLEPSSRGLTETGAGQLGPPQQSAFYLGTSLPRGYGTQVPDQPVISSGRGKPALTHRQLPKGCW